MGGEADFLAQGEVSRHAALSVLRHPAFNILAPDPYCRPWLLVETLSLRRTLRIVMHTEAGRHDMRGEARFPMSAPKSVVVTTLMLVTMAHVTLLAMNRAIPKTAEAEAVASVKASAAAFTRGRQGHVRRKRSLLSMPHELRGMAAFRARDES